MTHFVSLAKRKCMHSHSHTPASDGVYGVVCCVCCVQLGSWAASISFAPGRYSGIVDAGAGELGPVNPLGTANWKTATIFSEC